MEMLGFEVLTARDGDEAWDVFQRECPSLVISDTHMPNRNGLLLMRDVKDHSPSVPVILLTAYFQYRKLLNDFVHDLRPDGYLEKPLSLADLRRAIEKAMPLEAAAL